MLTAAAAGKAEGLAGVVRRQGAGSAAIAAEGLERLQGLYAVEAEIRGRATAVRRSERQARSRPIIVALEPWLRSKPQLVSKKSKLPEATRCTLAHERA